MLSPRENLVGHNATIGSLRKTRQGRIRFRRRLNASRSPSIPRLASREARRLPHVPLVMRTMSSRFSRPQVDSRAVKGSKLDLAEGSAADPVTYPLKSGWFPSSIITQFEIHPIIIQRMSNRGGMYRSMINRWLGSPIYFCRNFLQYIYSSFPVF